ncbi:MAG: hypothetical protein J6N70_03335 [Oribacterium sp.]|nr:hypothetical protein [Oribacterium sp.]
MKHNIKKRIAAILCALAVAVPMTANIAVSPKNGLTASVAVSTDYLSPTFVHQYCNPIPMFTQYGNHSCWAYILRSLTVYKYNYFPSDNELANIANNYTMNTGLPSLTYHPDSISPVDASISSGAFTYVVHNYFSNAFMFSHPVQHLSGATISSYINNDQPLIIFCSTQGEGHILLLYGYYASNVFGDNISYVEAYDPYDGSTKMLTVPTSGNATFNVNGLTYTWDKSILFQ